MKDPDVGIEREAQTSYHTQKMPVPSQYDGSSGDVDTRNQSVLLLYSRRME